MASAAGAEDVPVAPELLTPPLGLVALLGRPDLHPAVREALRTEARPPMECLSGGELEDASRVLVARKRSRPPADPLAAAAALAAANPAAPSAGAPPARCPDRARSRADRGTPGRSSPVATASAAPAPAPSADALHPGCLKAGWLAKHRRLRPALALVFLDREDVEGDPNRWISLSTRPTRAPPRRRPTASSRWWWWTRTASPRRRAGRSRRPARRGATAREIDPRR